MSAEQLAREARRHGLSVNDLVAAFNSLGDEIHERTVSDHVEMVIEASSTSLCSQTPYQKGLGHYEA